MNYSNQIFSFNITNKTEKITIDINKKSFFKDSPIFATATVYLKKIVKLPIKEITTGTTISNVKTLDICFPIQKDNIESENCEKKEKLQNQEIENKQNKKKIIQQMEIQLSFRAPFQNSDSEETDKEKKKKSKKLFIKN